MKLYRLVRPTGLEPEVTHGYLHHVMVSHLVASAVLSQPKWWALRFTKIREILRFFHLIHRLHQCQHSINHHFFILILQLHKIQPIKSIEFLLRILIQLLKTITIILVISIYIHLQVIYLLV